MNRHAIFFIVFTFLQTKQFYLNAQINWIPCNGPVGGSVNELAIVGNEWWAATEGGVFVSTNKGDSWQRSNIVPFGQPVESVYAIDEQQILLGVLSPVQDSTNKYKGLFYRSIDGGETWQVSIVDPNFFAISLSGRDFHIFPVAGNLFIKTYNSLYRSTDNGFTWSLPTVPIANPTGYSYYENEVILFNNSSEAIYSNDGGNTWEDLPLISNSIDLGCIELIGPSTILLYASLGEIYRSTDLGSNWQKLNDKPFGSTDVWKIFPSIGDTIIGLASAEWGLGIMLFISTDEGNSWVPLATETGNLVLDAIHQDGIFGVSTWTGYFKNSPGDFSLSPSNLGLLSSTIRAFYSVEDRIFATGSGGLFMSMDGGQNWQILHPKNVLNGVRDFAHSGDTIFALRDRSIMVSPDLGETWYSPNGDPWGDWFFNNAKKIYYADGKIVVVDNGLQVSNDGGSTWTGFPGLPSLPYINDFIPAGSCYFIVTALSGIWRSCDQGQTWQKTDAPISGGNLLIWNQGRLFVSGAYGTWYSDNLGVNWTNVQGLPLKPNLGLPHDMKSFVGRDSFQYAAMGNDSIYVSEDNGANWLPFDIQPPGFIIFKMIYHDTSLYISTSGNSVWRLAELPLPSSVETKTIPQAFLKILPNPAYNRISIEIKQTSLNSSMLIVSDALGRTISSQKTEGDVKTFLDIEKLPNGVYFVTLLLENGTLTERFIKN